MLKDGKAVPGCFGTKESGVFIAESIKLIERALNSGAKPIAILIKEKWVEELAQLLNRFEEASPKSTVFITDDKGFTDITGYKVVRGPVAAFIRPHELGVADVCHNAHRILVLSNINNYTNIGTIFRTAAALDVDGILVDPQCYDPLFRRAARVSMGAVLQIPWARIGNLNSVDGLAKLNNLGFKTVALALKDNALSIDNPVLALQDRLALVFGSEGFGLDEEIISKCDYVAKIPMSHGVDSLNVAVCAALAIWELRRR